jgi:ligand-binding sensor protein
MSMTDLMPKESWAALEEEIARRFNLNARVYDDKGFTFTGNANWCNTFCPTLRSAKQAIGAVCSTAHQAMGAEAKASGEPVADVCDAGLLKIVAPVFRDGELIGFIGGCGALPPDGEVDTFMAQKASGLDESAFEEAAPSVPTMDQDKIDEAVEFMREWAEKASRGRG